MTKVIAEAKVRVRGKQDLMCAFFSSMTDEISDVTLT